MNNKEVILELSNITKKFGSVQALKQANLKVYKGQVMSLVGENGAGKSTLMKIISGVLQADSGQVFYLGQQVAFKNTHQSRLAGIAIIHQELNLLPHLSVAENLFLGQEPLTSLGTIDNKLLHQKAKQLLKAVHLDHIDLAQPVKNYSLAKQQMFEIAKALVFQPQVVIMDEPTSSLSPSDSEELFTIIKNLKQAGVAIVYISHRMDEVFRLSDDLTVLRDGQFITEQPITAMTEEKIIEAIVGRKITERYPYIEAEVRDELLQIKNLTATGVKGISATLYRGEVLGLAGLIGAGRTELAHTVYGLNPIESGQIRYLGKPLKVKNPKQALQQGIVYVSEDRKGNGLVLRMSIQENLTLSILSQLQGLLGQIDVKKEEEISRHFSQKLAIKTHSLQQPVKTLSGGNQQKVALARSLSCNPKLLILDEPTRGVDVGAKKEIYDLINQLKQEGLAIMLISSDLAEVSGLSDRIIVLAEGKLQATLSRQQATSQTLASYMVAHTGTRE